MSKTLIPSEAKNGNIRTRLIYTSSHCRGQISASVMTVLSQEHMVPLARRRKEGNTFLDVLNARLESAGFSHYEVREWLILSVLTENELKWLTSTATTNQISAPSNKRS